MWERLADYAVDLRDAVAQLDYKVVLAVIFIQLTVSTIYYFAVFKSLYARLLKRERSPVLSSNHLPSRPLWSLVGTAASLTALTIAVNLLARRLGIATWQDGLQMAGVLLLIDICLNARHHFFEGRPLPLFLLHACYQGITLALTCCLLAMYGQAQPAGAAAGGSGGGGGGGLADAAGAAAAAAAAHAFDGKTEL